MILDEEIDLTPEGKFRPPTSFWGFNRRVTEAKDKLFSRRWSPYSTSFNFITPSSELPWNRREVSFKERSKGNCKDPLSLDFGATIRITYDNTIMCFSDRKVDSLVLEEFFLESLGYIPYLSIKYCYECSRKYIGTLKNEVMLTLCPFHNTDRLPWVYRRRRLLG